MPSYVFPIYQAVITFPIAALIVWLPFLLFHYRKYGYVNRYRSMVLYSLLLYGMAAYYLVILPLPSTRDTCGLLAPGTSPVQTVPFTFVKDFLRETKVVWNEPSTYLGIIRERAFLQSTFNFLLLVPWGIYLRYYFRRSWLQTLVLSFLGSLFFELTQLSGLYGIYNCPYRFFDVDDLLLNTSGGMAGFLAAPLLTRLLPDTSQLDKGIDLANRPVSFTRRTVAFAFDGFLFLLAAAVLNIHSMSSWLIAIFLYFIVLTYATNGITVGKAIVRIQVKGKGDRLTFSELLIRYGLFFFICLFPNMLAFASLGESQWATALRILVFLGAGVIDIILSIHLFHALLRKEKLLFYEKQSGTRNAIIAPKAKKGVR